MPRAVQNVAAEVNQLLDSPLYVCGWLNDPTPSLDSLPGLSVETKTLVAPLGGFRWLLAHVFVLKDEPPWCAWLCGTYQATPAEAAIAYLHVHLWQLFWH